MTYKAGSGAFAAPLPALYFSHLGNAARHRSAEHRRRETVNTGGDPHSRYYKKCTVERNSPRGEHSKDLFLLLELAYKYFHLLPVNSDLNFALSDAIIAHIEFMLDKPHLSSISQAFETAIVNNYTNIYFTLDEVYRSIPYSKEYSRKIFLKEHGVTPAKFLLQKRLALAAQLLSARSDSKNRIADIAESCGFADPLYFSRIFKHEMKVSPKEYMITALEQNKVY